MSNLKLDSSKQFYPTPMNLARKMVKSVTKWGNITNILEPSAGNGNLILALAELDRQRLQVDCIEIQPELRVILKDRFDYRDWYNLSLDERKKYLYNKPVIVGDDFLNYNTYKKYDLILMNPPFKDGIKHLLKALEMQKNGGQIICLLNAETIKNPYTNDRKMLIQQLEKYGANIDYIENAFSTADNKTEVEIALIKVDIPQEVKIESEILKSLKKDRKILEEDFEVTALDITDFIQSMINRYNFELEIGYKLLDEYKSLRPYILNSFTSNDSSPLIEIRNPSKLDYLENTRKKYWATLLCHPKFIGKFPTNLQYQYKNKIEELKFYDFSEFNIKNLSIEMSSYLKESMEEEIIELFSKFTQEYSYYPECTSTIHYYNGWKTNKAHKIGMKVIIPDSSITYAWGNQFNERGIVEVINDIERTLNFLDGKFQKVDNFDIISNALENNQNRNIELKYFYLSFFKKGTFHIKFKNEYLPLIDRWNIYVGKKKSWLPPSYGKIKYEDMNTEEQVVIDSFQGKENYNKVFQNSNYYLTTMCNSSNILVLQTKKEDC